MPRLIALAGAMLNRLPPWCVRLAPRPVVLAAYRQLNRARLEGVERYAVLWVLPALPFCGCVRTSFVF